MHILPTSILEFGIEPTETLTEMRKKEIVVLEPPTNPSVSTMK